MKNILLIKQFEYIIPSSAQILSAMTSTTQQILQDDQPLMKVLFDFENGSLKLAGNRHFIITANKNKEAAAFKYQKSRLLIDADISPSFPIDLGDDGSDGLIWSLKGSIKNGNVSSPCSGLLLLHKMWNVYQSQWNISFHLYDLKFLKGEVKFKLPVSVLHKTNTYEKDFNNN
ncbi:MAG TPA: hypothetical protein VM012_10390 [Flavitalea sp.]|nr:hypothetical protein [Flavitalea sp.]